MWSIHLAVLRFPFLVELEFVNFVFWGEEIGRAHV